MASSRIPTAHIMMIAHLDHGRRFMLAIFSVVGALITKGTPIGQRCSIPFSPHLG